MALPLNGTLTPPPAIVSSGGCSGSNVTVERWNGGHFDKPLTRVTEVVQAVRQALDGVPVSVDGTTLKVSGFKLGRPAPYRVPIYVAALQERMIRQAVRAADGVITNWLSAEDVKQVAAVPAFTSIVMVLASVPTLYVLSIVKV